MGHTVIMSDTTFFQYCQKLVILSADTQRVLLARRSGEADYDVTYSFIGGKMETTDASILDGMKREKDEEIGANTRVAELTTFEPKIANIPELTAWALRKVTDTSLDRFEI